jgi:hypothetical protein
MFDGVQDLGPVGSEIRPRQGDDPSRVVVFRALAGGSEDLAVNFARYGFSLPSLVAIDKAAPLAECGFRQTPLGQVDVRTPDTPLSFFLHAFLIGNPCHTNTS